MFDFPFANLSEQNREKREKIATWYTMLLKKGADPSLCQFIYEDVDVSIFASTLMRNDWVGHLTLEQAANI